MAVKRICERVRFSLWGIVETRSNVGAPKTRWLMKTFLLLLPLLLASCAVDRTFDPYAGQDGDPDLWEIPSRPEDYIPPEA